MSEPKSDGEIKASSHRLATVAWDVYHTMKHLAQVVDSLATKASCIPDVLSTLEHVQKLIDKVECIEEPA